MAAGTDQVAVAFIAAGAVVLSAIVGASAAVVAAVYGRRNSAAIQEVHLSINSRLEELLKAAKFEGQIKERDTQRAIDADKKA
jgi:hypothetical protein